MASTAWWRAVGRRLAVALLMLGALGAARAGAESPAYRVILSYVPTVSNWGPADANGVVMVSYAEGDVRADLVGLPPLGKGDRYAMWLRNSGTGESFLLARFDSAGQGSTTYVDQQLPDAIPDHGWDTVLVTVEPEPDRDPAPDARRVLVGSIPGTPAETTLFPPVLPQTGAAPSDLGAALPLLAVNVALLALLAQGRRRAGARRGVRR